MKISELPKEIREKALEYQSNTRNTFTDNLQDAFLWDCTTEGYGYWNDLDDAKPTTEKPIQYQIGIDTFEIAEANMTLDERLACARFNISKYTFRKKGQDKQDFEKIINYANWALKQLENGK